MPDRWLCSTAKEKHKDVNKSFAMPTIQFTYFTGLTREIFANARLTGSWDGNGRYSEQWTTIPMQQTTGEDGCPCFTTTVELDDSQVGWLFRWAVILDSLAGADRWGIATEINDSNSAIATAVLHYNLTAVNRNQKAITSPIPVFWERKNTITMPPTSDSICRLVA